MLAGRARGTFTAPMAFDFRALRYFVAVAEELHFTRAAERLYIAQPALSEQIRRLEEELGVELLRRTTRKVELSAAGEEFLSRARRILAEADEALADASRAARGEMGRIRVATGTTAGVEQVSKVLRAFRDARPRVYLDLRETGWEDHSGGLRDGSVDAAFVWLPFGHEGLSFEILHVEPRVVALEAGHRLAAERELRVEQFVDGPWVEDPDPDPVALAFWTCADFRGGAGARRGPTVRKMEGMLEAVRAGLCVATLPRSQAQAAAWPGIAFRPVADLPPATLALGWREADETPVVQALVEIARRVTAGDSSAAPDESLANPSFTSGGGAGTVGRMERNEPVIRLGDEPVTLISVVDVDPANQEELVRLLTDGTEKVVQHRPGFVSVSVLASNDGTRVVNYAQWRNYDDIKGALADPEVQGYARMAAELAHATPHVYSVVAVRHAHNGAGDSSDRPD